MGKKTKTVVAISTVAGVIVPILKYAKIELTDIQSYLVSIFDAIGNYFSYALEILSSDVAIPVWLIVVGVLALSLLIIVYLRKDDKPTSNDGLDLSLEEIHITILGILFNSIGGVHISEIRRLNPGVNPNVINRVLVDLMDEDLAGGFGDVWSVRTKGTVFMENRP